MPSTVTAFSVKFALSGDGAMELAVAREVVHEWNSLHALGQQRVLLPLPNGETVPGDLLIAFFCASSGTVAERARAAIEAEIKQQLQAGKPALLYFSEARGDLTGTAASSRRALDEFRKLYAEALVDSYGDEKEFRAKLSRDVSATINTHAWFKTAASGRPAGAVHVPVTPAQLSTGKLSACAESILMEACDDFEAYVGRIKMGDSLKIQANGRQLVEQGDPTAAARWDAAFTELLAGGFIRDAGCNGQLFQISPTGFDYLATLGKFPVGYIAEMGGM